MKAPPPWFLAICILLVITAAGAYATQSFHKSSEPFYGGLIPAEPAVASFYSVYASALPPVSSSPGSEPGPAPAPPSAEYEDDEWPDREFLDVPYNVNQVIQQNIGNFSIFPSQKNLDLASSVEENDKRDYSLVSKYVSNAENSSVIRPILTAMDPTDDSVKETVIDCKNNTKVSVREKVRIDGGRSLSEGSKNYNNGYEIKYLLQ